MGCSTSTFSPADTLNQQNYTIEDINAMERTSLEGSPNLEDLNPQTKSIPASETFVIPFDNGYRGNKDKVIIQSVGKRPPKRIQELIEQATASQCFCLQDLEDKLNKAEIRRKDFLQQKIENIQRTTIYDINVKSNKP